MKTKDTLKRIAWCPTSSYRRFRASGFDLATLSTGFNKAVDGRALIERGSLARFAKTLASLAETRGWGPLNREIAKQWAAIANTGTGVFTITLPKASRTGNDIDIKLVLTRGASSLPFADRVLSSIEAVERKPGWVTRLLRFLGVRRDPSSRAA